MTVLRREATAIQFTIGKMDAGVAILLSPDHYLLEFPATMLPTGVTTGSILNLTIERNVDQEHKQQEEFTALQQEIFNLFSHAPEPPLISTRAISQTSITVQWKPIVLHRCDLRGIDVYRNNQKLSMTVSPTSTLVKLTGLDMAHDYSIHLVMRTSAGDFHSNTITAKTHTLDNLTGIRVSFGQFSPGVEGEAEVERLIQIINRIGASYTEDLTTENTHLVCLVPRGPKYEKACEWNIPVVSADFLRACETHGKIQPVGQFYVAKER